MEDGRFDAAFFLFRKVYVVQVQDYAVLIEGSGELVHTEEETCRRYTFVKTHNFFGGHAVLGMVFTCVCLITAIIAIVAVFTGIKENSAV